MSDEKPSKVEAGQRWGFDRSPGNGFTVAESPWPAHPNMTTFNWDDGGEGAWNTAEIPDKYVFLGYAPGFGPSSQGVRAGQRREWRAIGIVTLETHPSVPGNFQLRRERGATGGVAFTAAEVERMSTLLPDTSPGEAETRERLLRELHEARARTVAVVENAATARIPATPCLRCGRMGCICARREVSPDGKAWINFDRLTDGDSFEAYRFRRLDGVELNMVTYEAPRVKIVGMYRGAAEMADGREKQAERTMIAIDSARHKLLPSKPQAISQCHAAMWGGVINIRGGR